MKLIVAAISARPPEWVVAGWQDYAKRMPRELSLELLEIKPESRTTGKNANAMMAAEASVFVQKGTSVYVRALELSFACCSM